MTVPVVDPPTTPASDATAPAVPAQWPARAGALAVDILPGAAQLATMVPVALSVPLRGVWWWVSVSIGAVAILLTAFNRLLPVIGGQSLGRAVSVSPSFTATPGPSGHGGCCCESWHTCSTPPRCSPVGCGRCGTRIDAPSPTC